MYRILALSCFFLLVFSKLFAIPTKHNFDDSASAYISVTTTERVSDSLHLMLWDDFYTEFSAYHVPYREFVSAIHDGQFTFRLANIDRIKYFSLGFIGNKGLVKPVLYLYLIEPGDRVQIDISKEEITFEGKGAEKYRCRFEIDQVRENNKKRIFDSPMKPILLDSSLSSVMNDLVQSTKRGDSLGGLQIATLNKYETKLSPFVFKVMKANLIGSIKYDNYKNWKTKLTMKQFQLHRRSAINYMNQYMYRFSVDKISDDILFQSYGYLNFINARVGRDEFSIDTAVSYVQRYEAIKKKYDGEVLDKLLTCFILEGSSHNPYQDSLLADALRTVTEPACFTLLKTISDNSRIGVSAYNFSLPDAAGKYVRLEDLKGKVVFIDFWYTGCVGCSNYYQTVVSKAKSYFRGNSKVIFVSVAIDTDLERWKRSIMTNLYTSPEAINLYTEKKGMNHPIIEHYKVFAYPTPMLIDQSGKICSTSAQLRMSEAGLVAAINSKIRKK